VALDEVFEYLPVVEDHFGLVLDVELVEPILDVIDPVEPVLVTARFVLGVEGLAVTAAIEDCD
jgi:hypothetical protein